MRPLDNFTDSILQNSGLPRFTHEALNPALRAAIGAEKMEEVLNDLGKFKNLSQFARAFFERLTVDLQVQNQDLIPKTGACAVVANHPVGLPEVLALMERILEVRQDVKLLGNFILSELPGLDEYVIPVYLSPEDNRKAADRMRQQYEDEGLMLVFPAGLTSVKKQGIIKEQPWSGAVVKKAMQANEFLESRGSAPVSIVPAKITAKASNFFYRLQNISPAASEFLFLREALKQAGTKMGIEFLDTVKAPDDLNQVQAVTRDLQRSVEQF